MILQQTVQYIHVDTKSNHRSQKGGFIVKLWVKRKKTYDVFCFNVKTCVEHEEVIIFASELNTKERALDFMYVQQGHVCSTARLTISICLNIILMKECDMDDGSGKMY